MENQKNHSYKLGITQFTDLRSTEFNKKYYTTRKPVISHLPRGRHVRGTMQPDSVDWVLQGKVTSVKNQGKCQTCWTFGATATMESAVAIAGGSLVSLSPQELQDCDGDHSCDGDGNAGGNERQAIDYAHSNGLSSLEAYAFIEGNQTCQVSSSEGKALQPGVVTGWNEVDATEEDMMDAVAQQPVNVGLNAEYGGAVQHYHGGILRNTCTKGDDHAVVIVGYGIEDGVKYWKIKNSWGSGWGEDGYFRLSRGTDQCGVLDDACYPTVSLSSKVATFKD